MRRHRPPAAASRALCRLLGALSIALAPAPVAGAQSSTCEFAAAGWISTQMELRDARRAYRACIREGRTSCTAEQGRVRLLEQRLKLLRNYLDGYCAR